MESFEGLVMQLGLLAGDFGFEGTVKLSQSIPIVAAFELPAKFTNTTV